MQIDIPDAMWQHLRDQIDNADYCYLCDHHPSSGHAPDCPLFTADDAPHGLFTT